LASSSLDPLACSDPSMQLQTRFYTSGSHGTLSVTALLAVPNIRVDLSQVRRKFRPELLNRLDEMVVFTPLSHTQLRQVARLQMTDVAARLAERGIALSVTDAALDLVLKVSCHSAPTIVS
jgi:hypothetical protein